MTDLFAVGTRCGEWTIRKYLDGSGQSQIYLADRKDFSGKTIKAAIRTIKFDRLSSEDELKIVQRAFAVEYDALRKFNSEFIADAYDYGVEPHFWIATEFIDGDSLAQRLRLGPLNEYEWHSFAKDAIRGLMHAHDRKIVHQDVKPGNIMIRHKDGKALWIDFGSASVIGKQDKGYNGGGQTLAYSAPERMDGRKKGDSRTDMFSLGVLLFEAATGQIPWEIPASVRTEQDKYQSLYESKMRAMFNPSLLKPSQRKLVTSLLNPDPEKRPTAVAALKHLGADQEEIHGGTQFSGNIRPQAPKSKNIHPRQKNETQPRHVSEVKRPAFQVSSPSKQAEEPGNMRTLSLFLCWATFGLFHPIVTFIWYYRTRAQKYLRNGLIETFLSILTIALIYGLPQVVDPITQELEVDPKFSFLVGISGLAMWIFNFISHSQRPR